MSSSVSGSYAIEETGQKFTDSYRAYLSCDNKIVSPFHDIPLKGEGYADNEFNAVIEVSRWTNAKMEINKEDKLNPIKQDVKKGKMRYIANVFPFHGYMWNYGAIPQTWESPHDTDAHTGEKGDNDPIDLCDISEIVSPLGSVIKVKVLGVLAMIDDGETDWKVIVINCADPNASKYNNIDDVKSLNHGLLNETVNWFKYYKVPDGKPINKFAFNEEYKDRDFAVNIINHCHESWKDLTSGKAAAAGIAVTNTSLGNNESISGEAASEFIKSQPEHIPAASVPHAVHTPFYLPSKM